jgi:hypothetical protein
MTAFVEVTGVVDGARFRFQCPHCSMEHAWSAQQVMNMADAAIADYCGSCGGGIRVLKPALSRAGSATMAAGTIPAQSRPEVHSIAPLPSTNGRTSSPGFRYKVVPFIGRIQGNVSAANVADQLESAIRQHASAGWEFHQVSDVNVEVQPGCIAGLFGGTVQYVRFDQLIFRSRTD